MLPGLTALEMGRLRLSVGYGRNKGGRPLSPIEVGEHVRNALNAGISMEQTAREMKLEGTTHLQRFLRVLDIPLDVRHLIGWGAASNTVGFSSAVELTKLPDPADQRALARDVIAHRLNSKEVRQAVQLRRRSRRVIAECVREILGMRTIIERRHVFIGSIASPTQRDALGRMTQQERDACLATALKRIGILETTGRLGDRVFTLVGNDALAGLIRKEGAHTLESSILAHVEEVVEHGEPTG